MSVATRPKGAWFTSAYCRMDEVRYDAGDLVVLFGDGTHARVNAATLVPPHIPTPDWTRLTFDDQEIVVATAGGPFEIPWDQIRILSDPAFDAHLRAMAVEENRIVGAKIAALRAARGLTIPELATEADISAATLANIEAGKVAASFETLEQVLRPLGAALDALIVDSENPLT